MQIKINGTDSELPEGLSIQDLVSSRGLPSRGIIIELNGQIVRRESWESVKFKPGDSLEIIRIIGGG